jgi:DNA (cytosine-5)-methyltransferase 1
VGGEATAADVAGGGNVTTLYNEIEPYAANWLVNLIAAGEIADGRVERRSIADLTPDDVSGSGQRHFFAGIGVWSYALRLVGVADDADVWTGSCPCQPFSAAGAGRGADDERHLWPAWYRLIRECRPPIVFGEQVASRAGLHWLAAVSADLAGLGYAVGAADLPAASVGAPHIRQRLFWVAYADPSGLRQLGSGLPTDGYPQPRSDADGRGEESGLVHANEPQSREARGSSPKDGGLGRAGAALGLADSASSRYEKARRRGEGEGRLSVIAPECGREGALNPWRDCDWLPCADGVWRPVSAGSFPLVDGAAFRVGSGCPEEGQSRAGMLRGYGNAIVPQVAAIFVRCALDAAAEAAERAWEARQRRLTWLGVGT